MNEKRKLNEMKRIVTISLLLIMTLMVNAQDKRFSPEKFEADLKAYITKEASLTTKEAVARAISSLIPRNNCLSCVISRPN